MITTIERMAICCGIITLFFVSCSKEAGEGGSSSLTGQVWVRDVNSSGILVDEYPAQDERVYLVYGAEGVYDDDMRTHYDGSYEFNYLRKGTYSVYAYSDCDTCPGGQTAIEVEVEISNRNQTVEAPLITITK